MSPILFTYTRMFIHAYRYTKKTNMKGLRWLSLNVSIAKDFLFYALVCFTKFYNVKILSGNMKFKVPACTRACAYTHTHTHTLPNSIGKKITPSSSYIRKMKIGLTYY